MKLYELGRKYLRNLGTVGIEIETESKSPYEEPDLKYWSVHGDGSLRNYGVEYVLRTPLDHGSKEYAEALVEFEGMTKKVKFEKSTYTSVHVHLNFVEREAIHLANFIVLYVLVENVLSRYCGPDRDGNLFCLKVKDAEQSLALYKSFFEFTGKGSYYYFTSTLNENYSKYSALNIVPLRNLGSVEVRTHPGVTDTRLINRWVEMLMCLYSSAQKYENPLIILKELQGYGSNIEFVKSIFGKLSDYFDQKTIDNDVFENFFYAKSLVYCVSDWSKFGLVEKKERFATDYVVVDDADQVTPDIWNRLATLENLRTLTVTDTPTRRRRGRVIQTATLTTDE